jgi:hypothetical protein
VLSVAGLIYLINKLFLSWDHSIRTLVNNISPQVFIW